EERLRSWRRWALGHGASSTPPQSSLNEPYRHKAGGEPRQRIVDLGVLDSDEARNMVRQAVHLAIRWKISMRRTGKQLVRDLARPTRPKNRELSQCLIKR